jgi:hypothetical protein
MMRVNPGNGEHTDLAPGVRFTTPTGVALDGNDNLLVTDADIQGLASRLHRLDQGAAPRILATAKPPRAVYFGIAIEGTGKILVVNNPNGPQRELLRFDPTNGAMAKVSSGNKLIAHSGVAVEANGQILVIDQVVGVVRIDPNNGSQTVVSSGGHLAGATGGPTGLTVRR